jgi:hypothetical protein
MSKNLTNVQSVQAGSGTHLLIKVPDFGDTSFFQRDATTKAVSEPVDTTVSTFLRLGAFNYAQETDRAKALLKMIHRAGPPGDPDRTDNLMIGANAAWPWSDGDSFETVPPLQARSTAAPADKAGNHDVFFLDDVRKRPQDVGLTSDKCPDHGLSMAQRQKESARLYARGGWRDHTDGNRITTTYGDKIEVIRGNYKMIVLGRQDDPEQAMGWEASGSHVMDYAPGTMPGASYWLEWIKDYDGATSDKPDGVWLLVNTTEGVYEYARKAGNFREESWGDVHEAYVGSESPPDNHGKFGTATKGYQGHDPPHRIEGLNYDFPRTKDDRHVPPFSADNAGVIRSNPHIIEKTWARRIDSWTGSPDCLVPHIEEKTFAHTTKSYTGDSDHRVVDAYEETYVEKTEELVDASVRMVSNVRAGAIIGATTAGTIIEATTAALIIEGTTAGVQIETNAALFHLSVEAGAAVEAFFGLKFEFDLAGVWEFAVFGHHDLKDKRNEVTIERMLVAVNEYVVTASKTNTAMMDKEVAMFKAITATKVSLGL